MAKRNFTDKEELEIAEIYESGYSAIAIARMNGLEYKDSVIGALRRTNTPVRSPDARNRLYKVNTRAFDEIGASAAYWWGFLFADGHVSNKKSLTVKLKLADREHLVKLRKFLQCEHPIKTVIAKAGGKTYPQSLLYVTHKHLGGRLHDLGIQVGRPTVEPIREHLPEEYQSHFIRGIFDGDGSINFRNGQPVFRICCDYDLGTLLWEMIESNGALIGKKSLTKHRTANIWYITKSGRNVVRPIVKFMYEKAPIYLDRKLEVAKRCM